jgi:hypothetical protein
MNQPWWGEILFGVCFGVGFGLVTWALGKILK